MDLTATGRSARAACASLLLLAGCGSDVAPGSAAAVPRASSSAGEAPARAATIDEARIGDHLDALQAIADANAGVRTVGTAPPGSARITDLLAAWFDEQDLPWAPADLGGSSDHYGFQVAGIPTGGLFAGATASGSAASPGSSVAPVAPDPCYHLACDDRSNVDVERVTTFATAIADVVLALTEESP